LRILFVALTRAKIGLHLTSFTRTYSGKGIKHLKFFDEQEQEDGTFRSLVLPERAQLVQASDHQAPTLESLELHWRQRHIDAARAHDISEAESVDLRALLSERLKHYQLSPTHLTRFIDLEYGGPDSFLLTTLLCFPQAPSLNSLFGNAIHATLEWMQHQVTATQLLPTIGAATTFFAELLKREQLTPAQYAIEHDRGAKALSAYLTQHGSMFQPTDKAEHNFKNEGVFVGDAHLAGKVDRMEIDRTARVITVVDYKTGRPHARWSNSDAKLYKYSLQLYCYKLLIEGSRTYRGYTVNAGRLEFIEPDADGTIHAISLTFQDDELARVRELLQAMWRRVQILDLPGVSSYNNSLAGIRQFEADLLTNQDKPSNMA
jgi:ATP-dependent exoDNAse (exonuclease V) beta subunit